MKVNVIGACNIDITAFPKNKIKMHDSNICKIEYTLGGVARNIAHNLSLLDIDVSLFSAISNDSNGKLIIDSCKKNSINLDHALFTDKFNQSIYLCINDENKDMLIGANDMDIVSLISIDYIKENINYINDCDCLVFDANLDIETIEYLLDNINVDIFIESVSANKCEKLAKIIEKNKNLNIHTIKANKIEAEILGNIKIKDNNDLDIIAKKLHSKGIKNVCITLGENGAYYFDGVNSFITKNKQVNVVNTTGAGDAFFAGLIYGYLKNKAPTELINYGLAGAKIALESFSAVSDNMSVINIEKLK